MNTEQQPATLNALVEQRFEADTEFQSTLEGMTDDEKTEAISAKKSELVEAVFAETAATATKNGELAENYKTRAEKAEGKKPKPAAETEKKDELSSTDLYALMQAQVHQDDVAEVSKAAALLGKSISEALKDSTVQAILSTRVEHRKTAEATSTGPARPGTKRSTDAQVVEEAQKGNVPEKGSPEAEQLFWAKRGGKPKS